MGYGGRGGIVLLVRDIGTRWKFLPIYPPFCGERNRYLAQGTRASLSSHDALDVHPKWSGLPTASSASCLRWHILWVLSSAHSRTMEAVATVMMHLARLAVSSPPLRAPHTAFRQLPVLVWRCTKPGRQGDQILYGGA